MTRIRQIAEQINNQSKNFKIGKLQELRSSFHSKRQPTKKIFSPTTTKDTYAYHHGGRKELQFNIGIEKNGNIRHGVAFSLQQDINVPDVTIFSPKIIKFNEYMRSSEEYSDMMWWYYDKNGRSMNYKAGIIDSDITQREVFIFLGKLQKEKGFSLSDEYIREVLSDFDRLLPLYIHVESE